MLLLNIVWGASLPATKVGLTEFSPAVFAFLRLAASSIAFVGLLIARGELARLGRVDWLTLAALGVVGYGGTIGLQTLGANGTTAASASVLSATAPLFIALLAPTLLGERPGARAIAGVVVCLAGIFLVLGIDPLDPALRDARDLGGNALVLGGAACVAIFAVVGKRIGRQYSPLAVSGVTCLSGTAVLAIPAAIELSARWPQPTLLGWSMVVFLGLVVTVVGMVVWFWALRFVPASRGGPFLFVQAVSGLALAALVLGDALSSGFLVGAALVLVGLSIVSGVK